MTRENFGLSPGSGSFLGLKLCGKLDFIDDKIRPRIREAQILLRPPGLEPGTHRL